MRRPFALIVPLIALAVAAPAAQAATPSYATPEDGFAVFRDMRSYAVTEIRDAENGRVVASSVSVGQEDAGGAECSDPRHKLASAYWKSFEPYVVNAASAPRYLSRSAALADLRASHEAWESPFTTNCLGAVEPSSYDAVYGGTTSRHASLVANLAADAVNAVAFQSLEGTVCDGAVACVVVDYKGNTIREADLAFERDLTRYGFEDEWTTGETTAFDSVGGVFALIDVGTHEFGHFAGLDHVAKSPALTMFPFVHDGDQTLGLGDINGLLKRY